jgi:lipoprotein-anchoring transpeptidase ErfK/SrfK
MRRSNLLMLLLLGLSVAVAGGLSYAFSGLPRSTPPRHVDAPPRVERAPTKHDNQAEARAEQRRQAQLDAMLDRDYPMHGLVTTAQLPVREHPDPEAMTIGWLRLGGRVRLKRGSTPTPTCASGFYELYPRGYACAGQGIQVADHPPASEIADAAADTSGSLPYSYYLVREPLVPEYYSMPTRAQQNAAQAVVDRYAQLIAAGDTRRAQMLRDGQAPNEPASPAVVARYLDRGFYVAGLGFGFRNERRFVRTVRGTYVKEAQLEQRTGADFAGVELDEETTLPIAFAVRAARPMRRVVDGSGHERFVDDETIEPYPRLGRIPWLRRERHGTDIYHVIRGPDDEPRYLHVWFASVAERRPIPLNLAPDEPWVHVDVGEQTLVLYRGSTPIYATLVSTGLPGYDTPIGRYRINRKFISATMDNIGPEAGADSYRIEDIPWTQYFQGSVALHGTFWHARFGLRRSHGCVNLSPRDARYLFDHMWPEIPEGWHGVTTEGQSGFHGSRVIVTE